MITAAELLFGADEDAVVNAYLAVLGRWPDEGGMAHHLAAIRGRPERRIAMLREIAGSEEARLAGRGMPPEEGPDPPPPDRALAAQLRLRTDFLRAELARAARPEAEQVPPGFVDDLSAVAADFEAFRREARARLDALERARAESAPAEPTPAPGFADYVLDLLAASEARVLDRLRALERRAFGDKTG